MRNPCHLNLSGPPSWHRVKAPHHLSSTLITFGAVLLFLYKKLLTKLKIVISKEPEYAVEVLSNFPYAVACSTR